MDYAAGSEEGEGQTQLGCEGGKNLVEEKKGQSQLDCEEEQIAG